MSGEVVAFDFEITRAESVTLETTPVVSLDFALEFLAELDLEIDQVVLFDWER